MEGRLAAALLYVGSRAALSHGAGLWAWTLIATPPTPIDVSTPRRKLSVPGVRVRGVLGHGRPGSATLRRALDQHQPLLARAASDGEELLIELCEDHGIPLPELNVWLHGFKVDALWREERLVVEVDSGSAHGTPARMEADRERDLALRADGCAVVRYTWHQLTEHPRRVAHDLLTQLNRAA